MKNERLQQIRAITERMKRLIYLPMKGSKGNLHLLDNIKLDNLGSKERFTTGTWELILDLLIAPASPSSVFQIRARQAPQALNDISKFPKLKNGQTAFCLLWFFNSSQRSQWSWYILSFKHSSAEVQVYTVRQPYLTHACLYHYLDAVSAAVGVPAYKLDVRVHQVRPEFLSVYAI